MPRSSVTIDIAAPPERAWTVISDVERWHEWTPSITRVRLLGQRPFGIGSRAFIRQPKLPPALWTVTNIVPGRSFTWVSVAPGLRVSGFHGVEPTLDGSRATLAIDIQGLFGGLWARLSKGITERYLAYEAAGLKARSEDGGYRDDGAKV